MVPVADEVTNSQSTNVVETAINVYVLSSTKEVIRFLYAPLEYPTQATLLTAAKHGNLITFPGLTPENISRRSSKSRAGRERS